VDSWVSRVGISPLGDSGVICEWSGGGWSFLPRGAGEFLLPKRGISFCVTMTFPYISNKEASAVVESAWVMSGGEGGSTPFFLGRIWKMVLVRARRVGFCFGGGEGYCQTSYWWGMCPSGESRLYFSDVSYPFPISHFFDPHPLFVGDFENTYFFPLFISCVYYSQGSPPPSPPKETHLPFFIHMGAHPMKAQPSGTPSRNYRESLFACLLVCRLSYNPRGEISGLLFEMDTFSGLARKTSWIPGLAAQRHLSLLWKSPLFFTHSLFLYNGKSPAWRLCLSSLIARFLTFLSRLS